MFNLTNSRAFFHASLNTHKMQQQLGRKESLARSNAAREILKAAGLKPTSYFYFKEGEPKAKAEAAKQADIAADKMRIALELAGDDFPVWTGEGVTM